MIDTILKHKEQEVALRKKAHPIDATSLQQSQKDFKTALQKEGLSLIAEIKRKSLSNTLNESVDIAKTVQIYDRHAAAISVLTDKHFFGGSLEDLELVSTLSSLPVLRKDFIIDTYQMYEARAYGADAILLIVSVLSKEKLGECMQIARELGMDALVEVHSKGELAIALEVGADIIGINNRNLKNLEVNTAATAQLAADIPKEIVVVSESGISSREYVHSIRDSVHGILVGSYFMLSDDIEEAIVGLLQ